MISRLLAGSLVLLLSAPALAQAPLTISTQGSGDLPGFRINDAAPYLAQQMNRAVSNGWHFVPGDPAKTAPNRVEWQFALAPYAGGSIRQFFRLPEGLAGMHLQGQHRQVSAEARLYLNGEYQTMVADQETLQGGADDAELAAFLIQMTKSLAQAYNAVDQKPAAHSRAAP